VPIPRVNPATGAAVEPAACTADQKNSAVSSPSRATARNAVTTTASVPSWSALSSRPLRAARMPRAVRRIQKIIQVTAATATSDMVPPKTSREDPVRSSEVDV